MVNKQMVNLEVLAEKVANLEQKHAESQDRLNGNLQRLWKAQENLVTTIERKDVENKEEHKEILKETKKWPKGLAIAVTLLSSAVTGLLVALANQVASRFVP